MEDPISLVGSPKMNYSGGSGGLRAYKDSARCHRMEINSTSPEKHDRRLSSQFRSSEHEFSPAENQRASSQKTVISQGPQPRHPQSHHLSLQSYSYLDTVQRPVRDPERKRIHSPEDETHHQKRARTYNWAFHNHIPRTTYKSATGDDEDVEDAGNYCSERIIAQRVRYMTPMNETWSELLPGSWTRGLVENVQNVRQLAKTTVASTRRAESLEMLGQHIESINGRAVEVNHAEEKSLHMRPRINQFSNTEGLGQSHGGTISPPRRPSHSQGTHLPLSKNVSRACQAHREFMRQHRAEEGIASLSSKMHVNSPPAIPQSSLEAQRQVSVPSIVYPLSESNLALLSRQARQPMGLYQQNISRNSALQRLAGLYHASMPREAEYGQFQHLGSVKEVGPVLQRNESLQSWRWERKGKTSRLQVAPPFNTRHTQIREGSTGDFSLADSGFGSYSAVEDTRDINQYFIPHNCKRLPQTNGRSAVIPHPSDRSIIDLEQCSKRLTAKPRGKEKATEIPAAPQSFEVLDRVEKYLLDGYYEQFFEPEDAEEPQQGAAAGMYIASSNTHVTTCLRSPTNPSKQRLAAQSPGNGHQHVELMGEDEIIKGKNPMNAKEGPCTIDPTSSLPMKHRLAPPATPHQPAWKRVQELKGRLTFLADHGVCWTNSGDQDTSARVVGSIFPAKYDDGSARDDNTARDDSSSREIDGKDNRDGNRLAKPHSQGDYKARKIAQRGLRRNKIIADEQARLAERRERTHEQIEASRQEEAAKRQAAVENFERKRQIATSVQVDVSALSKLKAQKEEARKRAATLSASRLSRLSANPDSVEHYDADGEDSLFIPDTVNPKSPAQESSPDTPANGEGFAERAASHQDALVRTKGSGSSNEPEPIPTMPSRWVGRSGYRADRIQFDAQKEAERLRVLNLRRTKWTEGLGKKRREIFAPESQLRRPVVKKSARSKTIPLHLSKPRNSRKKLRSELDESSLQDCYEAVDSLSPKDQVSASEHQQGNGSLATIPESAVATSIENTGASVKKGTQTGGRLPLATSSIHTSIPPKLGSRGRSSSRRAKTSNLLTLSPSESLGSSSISDTLLQSPTSPTPLAQSQFASRRQARLLSLPSIQEKFRSSPDQFKERHVPRRVKTISKTEHQALREAEQLRKQKEKEETKRQRSEQAKMERRHREEQAARNKQRKSILEEAEAKGIKLTDEEVNKGIEARIAKRNRDNARRKENRERQQRIADFAPDTLMLESGGISRLSTLNPLSSYGADLEDREGDSPAILEFKRNARDTRDHRKALRKESIAGPRRVSNVNFTNNERAALAGEGNSIFYDSSDESIESPDDEDLNLRPANKHNKASVMSLGFSKGSGPRGSDNIKIDNAISSEMVPNGTAPGAATASNQLSGNPPTCNGFLAGSSATNMTAPGEWVRFYEISKQVIRKSIPQEVEPLSTFGVSLEGANNYAAALLRNYRTSLGKNLTVNESFTQDGHYKGSVTENNGDTTIFSVKASPKLSSSLDGVPMVKAIFLTTSIYNVQQTLTTKVYDPETSTTTVTVTSEPVPGQTYTDREVANYKAAKYLIGFLKPKTSRIDDIITYNNEVVPQIMRDRELFSDDGQLFCMDVERSEGSWFEFEALTVDVKLLQLTGPIN